MQRIYKVHVQVTYDFPVHVKAKNAGEAETIAKANIDNYIECRSGDSRAVDVVKVEVE